MSEYFVYAAETPPSKLQGWVVQLVMGVNIGHLIYQYISRVDYNKKFFIMKYIFLLAMWILCGLCVLHTSTIFSDYLRNVFFIYVTCNLQICTNVILEIHNCPQQTQLPLFLKMLYSCYNNTRVTMCMYDNNPHALNHRVDISMHTLTNYQDPPGKLELKQYN